jgi:hypothetical protein
MKELIASESFQVMSTELVCPDCGGIIGGSPDDPGRACSCWSNKASGASSENRSKTSGETVVEKAAAHPQTKICCQCGKDLAGKKRLRDSRGYWCYACHKLDQEANKPKGEKCADCGRVVATSALSDFEGRKICGSCRNDRKEMAVAERRRNGINTSQYDRLAKSRLLWMVAIVAVLLAIILLKHFNIIG